MPTKKTETKKQRKPRALKKREPKPKKETKGGRPKKNESGQTFNEKAQKWETGRPPIIQINLNTYEDEYGIERTTFDVVHGADKLIKLENAFKTRASIREACLSAGISVQAYYNFIDNYPDYVEHFENLRQSMRLQAKTNISKQILSGDVKTSQWMLERIDPEYSTKISQENNNREVDPNNGMDFSDFSDEELDQLERLHQKAIDTANTNKAKQAKENGPKK